jgi:hypothetical protein
MRNKYQGGDAHVVIIVVLILALLGALGFVAYQNFIVKKSADGSAMTESDQKPVETTTTARFAFNNAVYAAEYPKDWSKKVLDQAGNGYEFRNPDETVKVRFEVAEGGIGGSCDPTSPLKVRFYKVSSAGVTKLGKTPAYLVETMTDADGGGYNYKIGLTEDGGETHAAVGDSHCTVAYVGIAARLIVDIQTNVIEQPTTIAEIEFPKLAEDKTNPRKVKEMQPVKDMLASSDYKAAVKLLESTRKE